MSTTPRDEQVHRLRVPVAAEDWWRGPDRAPVTLVEYFDYECSHCQAIYSVLERVFTAYRDRLRLVARHFPVVSSHPHALDAALAAEGAGRQGKFWEMHARLFENPGRLAPPDLMQHARELRLDLKRFEADLNDPELTARIQQQKLQGARSGVNGTPTLFLNDVRYDGPRDFEGLSQAVETAAASAQRGK